MSSFGERLREERDRLGFNQTALGAIGGVLKQAQIKYEKGERAPDVTYLEAVAKVGVDVQYAITGQRSSTALSEEEIELLEHFRAAPLAVKAAALGALQGAAHAERASKSITINAPGGHVAGRNMTIKRK